MAELFDSDAAARSIAEVVLMRAAAVTHGFNQNQRYVGCVITSRTASEVHTTSPPDGNIAPPGWYLLFLLDVDRVPSTGAWIRLSQILLLYELPGHCWPRTCDRLRP